MSTTQDHTAPYYLTAPHCLKELVPLATTVALNRAAELTPDPVLRDLLAEVERSMFRLRDHLSGRPIRSTYAQLDAELALLASAPQ